jgi:hypothetical protein
VDDSLPRYKAWEGEASLTVTINVLDHHTGVRHPALEAHTAVAARALLVVTACALQHLAQSEEDLGDLDPGVLEDLVESFSFSEVKKRSLSARHCTVLCDTVSDKTTLLETGGVILPMELHTIFITFAPTADDATRTSLPKELRLALLSHKNLFFKGGLTLQVASSIPAHPEYIFQAALTGADRQGPNAHRASPPSIGCDRREDTPRPRPVAQRTAPKDS